MNAVDRALQAAAAHVNAERLPAALAGLLDTWRELGSPAIADAIDAIGARIAEKQPSLAGKTVTAKRAWNKVAREQQAQDLDRLLASWRDVPADEVAARAKLLSEWPEDPRRDRALAKILHEAPYRTTSKVWTQLVALTELVADRRQLEPLRELGPLYTRILNHATTSKIRQRMAAVLEPVIARLEAINPLAPSGPHAALTTTPARATVRVDDLRDRVFAQPDDLALRAIYADALSEAGDPLGEFITLSLLASLDKTQAARRAALAKSHLPSLLGPLAKVVFKRELEFEGGLLSRCTVDTQSPQLVEAAVGNPFWSTVVDLHGPANVFLHPVMRSLRRLRLMDDDALPALLEHPLPIHTLACDVGPSVVGKLDPRRLSTLRHLRAYSCNADPLALLDAPITKQLDTLWVDLPWMWRRWAKALVDKPCAATTVTLIAHESYQHIELTCARGSNGVHGDIQIRFVAPSNRHELEDRVEAVIAILEALDAKRVTKLAVTPSRKVEPTLQAKIDDAMGRFA